MSPSGAVPKCGALLGYCCFTRESRPLADVLASSAHGPKRKRPGKSGAAPLRAVAPMVGTIDPDQGQMLTERHHWRQGAAKFCMMLQRLHHRYNSGKAAFLMRLAFLLIVLVLTAVVAPTSQAHASGATNALLAASVDNHPTGDSDCPDRLGGGGYCHCCASSSACPLSAIVGTFDLERRIQKGSTIAVDDKTFAGTTVGPEVQPPQLSLQV